MSPEEKQMLQHHVQEIAKILYRASDPEDIQTLEGIEKIIRAQTLEHVSPQLGIFLSNKRREQKEDGKES